MQGQESSVATLDELLDVLHGGGDDVTKATSLRLPERVHRAASLATQLGMAESLTAATTEALLAHVRAFARQRAIADHLAAYPADTPELSTVTELRVAGTDHAAASHPDLVAEVAGWYERRHPDWATSGRVDVAVDRVLEHVEFLLATRRPASTTAQT